jgi:hypothetical protein
VAAAAAAAAAARARRAGAAGRAAALRILRATAAAVCTTMIHPVPRGVQLLMLVMQVFVMMVSGLLQKESSRLGAVEHDETPHNSSVGPLGVHEWRNDSANIRLVKAWNDLLALSPLSREFAGAVNDDPPVALDWAVGADMPIGWKNGVACRFGNQIVLAGGLFQSSSVWLKKYDSLPGFNLSTFPNTAPALLYNIDLNTWSHIPSPPFVPGRTQGACSTVPGAEAMFVVSGGHDSIPCDYTLKNDKACEKVCCHYPCGNNPGCTAKVSCHSQPGCRPIGGNVTRLTRDATTGEWRWSTLPSLPTYGPRFVGVAGLVDNEWLVLTGGSNMDPGAGWSGNEHANGSLAPGYRLQLKLLGSPPVLTPVGKWKVMAPQPLDKNAVHGMTIPVGGALGRSWYTFGGQATDLNRTMAYNEVASVCVGTPGCSDFPHTVSCCLSYTSTQRVSTRERDPCCCLVYCGRYLMVVYTHRGSLTDTTSTQTAGHRSRHFHRQCKAVASK